jgi:inosose dehydratase
MESEEITMDLQSSRRKFVAAISGAAAGAALAPRAAFAAPSGTPGIRYGYAAMTWGKEEKQAINDISAAGFEGIQFRLEAVTEFQPAELRDILQQHKLTFVALSSGQISIDPATRAEQITKHVANAKYVHDAGGLYLQILDELKPYPRKASAEDCKQLGKMLTELGKRTADLGVPLGYHNHMNTIGEGPRNLDIILETADPQYVKLEPDTAHSVAGGGDPAKAIEQYHDRLLFLHLKDVVDSPMSGTSASSTYPFTWVELGRGRVNLPAVFAALAKVKYHGWGVVELDRVPDNSRTPKQSAIISRNYLEKKIGVAFQSAAL